MKFLRLLNLLLLLRYLRGFGNGRSFVQANPRLHMKHGKKFRVGFEGANDVGWKELNFGTWIEERELNGVWVNLLFGAFVVGCRVKVWV